MASCLQANEARLTRQTRELAQTNETLQQEIVEHQMTEQALRMSQQYAKSIIHSSLDMIIAVDQERNIIESMRPLKKPLVILRKKCLENISACYMRKHTKRLRFISEPSIPANVCRKL
jgi:hypothetical protein